MRASDRAYQRLREEILEGSLAPGALLGEVEQAERLGVSRTPLREALSRLASDGLADQTQGRGTVVSSVSLGDVDLLFELRLPLEVQAARLAAQRGDPARFSALAGRFGQAEEALRSREHPHEGPAGRDKGGAQCVDQEARYYDLTEELDDAIAEAVDNPYLTSILRGQRVHLVRVRRLARDEPSRLAESAREHRSVCAAIASADAETAGAAMLIHLRRSLAYITGRAALDDTPPEDHDQSARSSRPERNTTP